MFTGIVKDVGSVVSVRHQGGGLRLRLQHAGTERFGGLSIDESVSVNGVCQTVIAADDMWFDVDTVEETLGKTTLGSFRAGTLVNLERALRPVDRLGGHFVLGHVDCVGEVVGIRDIGNSREIRIGYPREFAGYLVPAGSIAIDGVSLTVASLKDFSFSVAIIPFTFSHTTIASFQGGSRVNLEFDILGKYVSRQLLSPRSGSAAVSRIDEAWLRENGF